jgi:hypothetical protein
MFCPKCGTQVEPGSSFCQKCGAAVSQPAAAPAPSPTSTASPFPNQTAMAVKTSGMAVAALVLGIVGMFFFPFVPSVLAIIFGALGIGQVNRSSGILKGKGMATAGIVLGIVSIVMMIIVIALWGFSMTWITDFANDMY